MIDTSTDVGKADFLFSSFAHTFGVFYDNISIEVKKRVAALTPDLIQNGDETLIFGIQDVYLRVWRIMKESGVPISRERL